MKKRSRKQLTLSKEKIRTLSGREAYGGAVAPSDACPSDTCRILCSRMDTGCSIPPIVR
jgi:hypothetical protein